MSARDALRCAVAAEFQRLDAHDWGYDHGFCADPDADEETAAFVDAAIRIVLAEAAGAIDEVADAAEEDAIASDGHAYGRANKAVAIHREDAALLRRLAAAPTTPTTKEK